MKEKFSQEEKRYYFSGGELVSRERALAMAKAAEAVGQMSVRILKNEGENYGHVSRRLGQPARVVEGVVPEGKVYVWKSGNMPADGRYHDIRDEELAKLQSEHKQAA